MCYCCEFTSVSVFVAQLSNKNLHRNVGHVELKTYFVIDSSICLEKSVA